jgi:phosphoglycolate phosphatase-like HAD superfamily hydrolase
MKKGVIADLIIFDLDGTLIDSTGDSGRYLKI